MSEESVKQRLVLIDGSSLAYRAYFALPETIATREGFPTNALYGFSQMLLKIVTEYAPAAVIVAWDAREKTFRHEEFAEYKAQRPHMPDPLSQQWPHFPELVDAFGFRNLVKAGFEADDILGTLAEEAKRQKVGSVIVTGDRDALQIVDDDIWVMSTGRGVTDIKVYTPAKVVERFGITPDKIPDFIGLKGDTSDNIPGVPGVGEKTAAALLQQFGSIDELYARIDEVASEKRRALLVEHEQSARLSKRLATMVLNVPLDVDLEELVSRRGYALPASRVEEVFRRFEFGSLVRRVQELARSGGAAASVADAAPASAAPADASPTAPAGAAPTDTSSAADADLSSETGAGAPADAAPSADVAAPSPPPPAPRLVIEEDVGALAALLEQKETGLAFVPVADGDGGTTCAAVFSGGEAVVAARVGEQVWRSLWLLAGHVVGHDVKSFPHFAEAPAGAAFDTAIAAYLLAPERPVVDLFELTRVAADVSLVDGPRDEAAAATRAVLTWQLAERQRGLLLDVGLERLFREIELPLARILARMEAVGVRMDPYRLGEITARVRDAVDETRDRIYGLAGGEFNIGSPPQLAEVLFTRLGLAPVRRGKTGFSTDARVLRTLRDQHPVVADVEEWRELTKLLNTYLDPLPERLDPATGRLHTTFNQTVTTTGRLSSSNPNLQNIPIRTELGSQIRACFVAEDGWRLIVADYSQIELRLMAHIAEEPALLDAFRRGEDVHRTTAAAIAGIAPEDVTPEQRQRAKATNFGIMYGLSAFGLSEQVGISREDARDFIDAYFARYPKVREFRDETIRRANDDGYVTTLFGRRRAMPELRSRNQRERSLGERLAVNTVLQGSAADIIKVAMIRASDELDRRKLSARLVLQVHDELIFEAPADEAEEVATLARETMCGAYVMDPPIEVSVGVGENWRDAK